MYFRALNQGEKEKVNKALRIFINHAATHGKKVGMWCMTITLLCYLFSAMLFSHTHIVGGQIIRHSHPDSSAQHTHTTSEMQAFRDIVPLFAFLFILTVSQPLLTSIRETFCYFSSETALAFTHFFYLRGPPVAVVS